MLLPGQELSFPFVFKSSNAGIFTETWALQTVPVLAFGEVIRITLRGVASQEDVNEHKREDLEVSCVHTFFYISFSGDDGSPTVWGRYGAFLCYIFCICDYISFVARLAAEFLCYVYIFCMCCVCIGSTLPSSHIERAESQSGSSGRQTSDQPNSEQHRHTPTQLSPPLTHHSCQLHPDRYLQQTLMPSLLHTQEEDVFKNQNPHVCEPYLAVWIP